MQAPRMRVAVLGQSVLAEGMAAAGHAVKVVENPADIATDFEMVVLGVDAGRLPVMVSLVESYVRPGLIVAHECLELGVQVLDDIEVRGGVVIAFGRITDRQWAVTANDELASTIAELIVGETGANVYALTDAERGPFAARCMQAALLRKLSTLAETELAMALGAEAPLAMDVSLSTETVTSAWQHEKEPGARRFYVELSRRLGEVLHRDDLEMWALQAEHSA